MVWLLEAAIVPLFLGASAAYGQFTSGVNLIEVYATVTDQQGEPIVGLTAADFRLPKTVPARPSRHLPRGSFRSRSRSVSIAASAWAGRTIGSLSPSQRPGPWWVRCGPAIR
jgi:hypothetical protein